MHRRIPKQRAALIAQSVLQLQPEHEQARAILIQAYDNSKDPRLLEVLDTDTGEHLQRTLKAIEQGNLTEAQASFAHPSRILRASFAHPSRIFSQDHPWMPSATMRSARNSSATNLSNSMRISLSYQKPNQTIQAAPHNLSTPAS
jgi:hypothetical protein